jgi:hypothetical protein
MNWFVTNAKKAEGITIKGFKTFKGRGEFGDKGGFEGTAILNGKAIATFADANDGGMLGLCDTQVFKDLAKKNFEDEPYSSAAEKFVYFLVQHHETLQALKRKAKTKVLGIDATCGDGQYVEWKREYSVEVANAIRTKFPGTYFIINEFL